jgi:hypothetical protein
MQVPALPNAPVLERLTLLILNSPCYSMRFLAQLHAPKVRQIWIMRNGVTEEGNDHLPGLAACINSWSPSLDSLFVGSCGVVTLVRGVTVSIDRLYIMGMNTLFDFGNNVPPNITAIAFQLPDFACSVDLKFITVQGPLQSGLCLVGSRQGCSRAALTTLMTIVAGRTLAASTW